MGKTDPIRHFEHSHGRLGAIALEVSSLLESARSRPGPKRWKQLADALAILRDELLRHFADEEEALFPFVRACVGSKASAVDKLEAAHDTICGAAVRMVHVASGERNVGTLVAVHERFEAAYARHSADENRLFTGLERILDGAQRRELAERLRGL